ncbi:hypothetical protein HXX51_25650 [Klebsiella pneumoniae]|uniref:hypothetical protein n=1 Tax=Klebsiella pneumoniae TaxID=573 RepID=UPI001B30D1CF|nr:hypothetical protein [Klebsiella pneumoniae]MBP3107086.1 hypothetical protein [Klebsiella pneumoniae]MBP3112699.1 hypothetical protein [Klebsiella pneumoniae]MBP3123791.1 hypothetical protein [Klebsiella pneumoniae]MBP3153559.1 hypothetical protein [Klebsiella pneumoniae]MBP3163202.1 hypothetical protein [Klebsiella pneumoniae]
MTITLQVVNELIASLESAGELSIRETKVMALAKAFKQLAAENVELKQSDRDLDKTCAEEFGQDWVSEFTETPATDRIVAGIKADGVEEFAAKLRIPGDDQFFDALAKGVALAADDFAKQLREGDGK